MIIGPHTLQEGKKRNGASKLYIFPILFHAIVRIIGPSSHVNGANRPILCHDPFFELRNVEATPLILISVDYRLKSQSTLTSYKECYTLLSMFCNVL